MRDRVRPSGPGRPAERRRADRGRGRALDPRVRNDDGVPAGRGILANSHQAIASIRRASSRAPGTADAPTRRCCNRARGKV